MKVLLLLFMSVSIWFCSMTTASPVQCDDEVCFKKPETAGSIQPKIEPQVKGNIQKIPPQKNTEPSRARRSVLLDTISGPFKNANIFSENQKIEPKSDQVKNPKHCHHITEAVSEDLQQINQTDDIDVTEAPTCCGHKNHKATECRPKRETDSDSDEEEKTEVAQTNSPCPPAQKNIKIIINNFVLASQEEDVKVNSTINDESESSTIELALEDDISAGV